MAWSVSSIFLARCTFAASLLALLACATSTHPTAPAQIGAVASSDDMINLLESPGPIIFERVVAADWVVERDGVINFDHP